MNETCFQAKQICLDHRKIFGRASSKNRPDFYTADSLDVESCTRLHVDSPAVYHGNNDDNEDDFSTCFNIDTSNDNSGLDDKN